MQSRPVRIPADDAAWLEPMAAAEHRSLPNMIHVLLLEARARRQDRDAAQQDPR